MNIDLVSILRNLGTGTSSLSPHTCSNIRSKVAAKDKQMKTSSAVIVLTITVCILSLFLTSSIISPNVYAADNIKNSSLIVTKQGSFVDSNGRFNIVGVVDNIGHVPVQVNMGLKTKDMNSGLVTTMIQPTYGKIIYPLTGAPFKFVVDDHNNSVIPSKAYISSIKETPTPYFKSLRLNYTNTPVGKDRSLVGTSKEHRTSRCS